VVSSWYQPVLPVFEVTGIDKLVNDHWNFLKKVIDMHDSSLDKDKKLSYAEFYFKEGMKHGYKHGKEGR